MNYSFLSQTLLFRGTSQEEVEAMLGCLGSSMKTYKKGETIFMAGSVTDSLGMVISGHVLVENIDVWGGKSILGYAEPGQIFAETYACIKGEPMMVSVIAGEDTKILFLNVGNIIHTCSNSCSHHEKLINNLLMISAQKNLSLSRRTLHTAPKSIRKRLLSYFSDQVLKAGKNCFTIPFNRQQLADYLNVDRSAMSNELSKMRDEGLIKYEKNRFELVGDRN